MFSYQHKSDPITIMPDMEGPKGRAWKVDLVRLCALFVEQGISTEKDSTLAVWVIEAPWAHPLWHSYLLILVHLRGFAENTKVYLKDASHELWLYAMNPDVPRNPQIAGESNPAWLNPKNFAAQMKEPSDQAALDKIAQAVRLVCYGALNPDTDHILHWAQIFGSNMLKPSAYQGDQIVTLTPDGKVNVVEFPKVQPPQAKDA